MKQMFKGYRGPKISTVSVLPREPTIDEADEDEYLESIVPDTDASALDKPIQPEVDALARFTQPLGQLAKSFLFTASDWFVSCFLC